MIPDSHSDPPACDTRLDSPRTGGDFWPFGPGPVRPFGARPGWVRVCMGQAG